MATLPTATAAPKQVQVVQAKPKLRVFKGDFGEYANFITQRGEVVMFYKGYTSTEDPVMADYIAALKGVEEVEVTPELKVPVPPERKRSRNWASASASQSGGEPTRISHAELLQRAVASSRTVPQAAESSSSAS